MAKQAAAVKRAARKAEKLHAEIYPVEGETTDAETPPESEAAPEAAEVPETPVSEVSGDTSGDQAPIESSVPVEPQPVPVAEGPSKWEEKYKTLQGMFNAQMPELQAKVKELTEKNNSLENIIASMQAPIEPTASAPGQSRLTQDEIMDYGEDMTDFVKRAAQDAVSGDLDQLRNENEKLKSQNLQLEKSVGNVNATQGADLRTAMLAKLGNEIPDWSEVNQSQEFLQWLQQTDAFSGQIRHTLLLDAFEANNAPRVIAFFDSYKRDKQLVAPREVQSEQPQAQVSMDALVAPGKGHAQTTLPPTDADSAGKVWTTAEIQNFYRDVQRGQYRGREADKARIEQQIVKAGREGRVR